MWNPCRFGGKCIDPGRPSDCEVNSMCVNFNSAEEKAVFDALPDKYIVEKEGHSSIRFKTKNQLRFFLTDFPNWRDANIFSLDANLEKDFRMEILINWE